MPTIRRICGWLKLFVDRLLRSVHSLVHQRLPLRMDIKQFGPIMQRELLQWKHRRPLPRLLQKLLARK